MGDNTDKALVELLTTREVDASGLIRVIPEENNQSHDPPATENLLIDNELVDLQRQKEPCSSEVYALSFSAREIAALMSKQVEAVVSRLVITRLPIIVERIISEEIRQLKLPVKCARNNNAH